MRSLPKAQKSQSIWSSAQVPASALILSFGNCHVRWWFPLRIKSQIHKVRSIIIEQKKCYYCASSVYIFCYIYIHSNQATIFVSILLPGKDSARHHKKEFVLIPWLQVSSLFCAVPPRQFPSRAGRGGPSLELCFPLFGAEICAP